jgi:signal peptidase
MKIETVGKIIKMVLFILVCFFAVVVIISALSLPKGLRMYVVRSGSMEPTIKTGDIIFAKVQSSYDVNDIVTYLPKTESDNIETITHRITGEEDSNFITKGDNNTNPDSETVTLKQIKGKYVSRFPLLGYLVSFLKTTPGLILFIIIPGTIIIYEEIRHLIFEIARMKGKNNNIKGKAK